MAETVRIDLAKPIVGHRGAITSLEVRAPGYDEYLSIGEPFIGAGVGESRYQIVNDEAVRAYIERLVVDLDPPLLRQLTLADLRRLRGAVLDFFLNQAEA